MHTRHLIEEVWQRQHFWQQLGWFALTPLSLGFSVVVQVRNILYNRGLFSAARLPLNVVSVGNLTVGGTGKTPLVLWLAQALQKHGYRVGILTRGYRGTNPGLTIVGMEGKPLATPDEVGDEAVMMARRFPGVVIAGRDRVAAAQRAHFEFGLDVVLLDDGFQYRRLQRDVDVLLMSREGNGNHWLLPAGPLREPLTAVKRADVVVFTKRASVEGHEQRHLVKEKITTPAFSADLMPTALVSVVQGQWQEQPLTLIAGKRVLAISGIAAPAPFYQTLRDHGAEMGEILEFPDHHGYTTTDWQTITHIGQKYDLIVTTEKDLVKLERFPFAADRLVALRVHMQISPAAPFLAAIERGFRYHKMDTTHYGCSLSHSGSN
jgi:tetraacyldisaccharide 4'-kinase